jgi:hypothetical protein
MVFRFFIEGRVEGVGGCITLKDQTKKMYQSSREICLRKSGARYADHFVEIIFTLSCAVVDIN